MSKKFRSTLRRKLLREPWKQEIIDHVLGSTAIEIGRIPLRLRKEIEAYDFKSHSLMCIVPTPLLGTNDD